VKPRKPAGVHPEAPTVQGVTFLQAAGKACMWPISGAGADMVVCGEARAIGDQAYCKAHRTASSPARSQAV
jgi:hypothetical protein